MTSHISKKGRVIPFLQNGEYFFKRGVNAYQRQEFERAVKYLKKAIDLRPNEGVFQCQLAAVLADMGQFERSNEWLHHVLDHLNPNMAECYFFLANNYAHQGLFDKAKETATTYLKRSPSGDFEKDAQELLEMLEQETEDTDGTDEQAAEDVENDELIINYEQAGRLIAGGHLSQARDMLEGLIVDFPAYRPAYTRLAYVLSLDGRLEEAIVYLEELMDDTAYVPALCQLALYYERQGRKDEADQCLEAMRPLVPLEPAQAKKLFSAFAAFGYYAEAYRWARRFERRSVDLLAVHLFYAGAAAFYENDSRRAERWWREAQAQGHTGAEMLLAAWAHGDLTVENLELELFEDLDHVFNM
ncbi:tetratricopeptide repeat protein [Salsuginibacillus halophilus]|uniref:Tetratricopeptide repeat protein n=1 Tax=Salsuginibacillus halophilus TaxID=517424 RepID=A0A2P8H962_9BACI|nr:tetratricopeptide repeat protein [Salsuginibacillus halophilus]PSL42767.1 tetratricopeptide repeat protein [Salsuginibacillus halophilus]